MQLQVPPMRSALECQHLWVGNDLELTHEGRVLARSQYTPTSRKPYLGDDLRSRCIHLGVPIHVHRVIRGARRFQLTLQTGCDAMTLLEGLDDWIIV
jgi:hypothetical protein